MKAIQVREHGGPEKLQLTEVPVPKPGPKQALVRIAVAGVNFIDVYFRTGLYKADLPLTPGNEAAGTVEAVGAEVTEVAVGDRVAYGMTRGAYAEYAVVPAGHAGEDTGPCGFRHGGGGHAARHDGALPDALDVSAETRRYVPGARGGGRSGRAGGADGQDVGGAGVRHGLHRSQSTGCARARGG